MGRGKGAASAAASLRDERSCGVDTKPQLPCLNLTAARGTETRDDACGWRACTASLCPSLSLPIPPSHFFFSLCLSLSLHHHESVERCTRCTHSTPVVLEPVNLRQALSAWRKRRGIRAAAWWGHDCFEWRREERSGGKGTAALTTQQHSQNK